MSIKHIVEAEEGGGKSSISCVDFCSHAALLHNGHSVFSYGRYQITTLVMFAEL